MLTKNKLTNIFKKIIKRFTFEQREVLCSEYPLRQKKTAENYLDHNFVITRANHTERFSRDQRCSSLAYDCFTFFWK